MFATGVTKEDSMNEDKKNQSNAAIQHESAYMNKGTAVESTQPTKPSPKLPVNTGDGWCKGEGTDMI